MRRLLLMVFTLLMLNWGLPCQALGQPEEPFRFTVGGESLHWVVWLDGSGRMQGNQVTYAQARPIITWAGGVTSPAAFRATFRIDDRPAGAVDVTVNDRSRHSTIMGVWKLVYPGRPSITAANANEVVTAIKETGEMILEWNGQQERIHWIYSDPDPRAAATNTPSSLTAVQPEREALSCYEKGRPSLVGRAPPGAMRLSW